MQGLLKPIILSAAFALMLWYALGNSPDSADPGGDGARRDLGYDSANDRGNAEQTDDNKPQPWSREERAIWRDNIDQRLRR